MKRLSFALMGALALTGCGSVRYPKTYVLSFPAPIRPAPPSTGALGSVAIRNFQCPEYLCEGRIVYRSSPEEVGFYEYHRWATNPGEAITEYMVENLRAQSLFNSVSVHERSSEAAYLLSGSIERLDEVDQGRDVRVVCTVSAQLLDVRTKAVVWSDTAKETVQVDKRDMRGVVSSLSSAARAAVDRLIKSMTEEVPATIALAPTPPQAAIAAGSPAAVCALCSPGTHAASEVPNKSSKD